MRKLIIILFCLLGLKLSAVTYYVATTGTDGAYPTRGTLANPFLTLQFGINYLREGDTLFIRGGVYSITTYINITGYDGTESNPICVYAYPADYTLGNVPIIDAGLCTSRTAVWMHDVNYWILNGITLRDANEWWNGSEYLNAYGFSSSRCKYITYRNMVAHNINGTAFSCDQANTIVSYYNCDAYNNADSLTHDPGNFGTGFLAIGAYADPDTSKWLEVYYHGCRVWNCSDNGFGASSGIKRFVVDSCWAFNLGYLEYGAGRGFVPGLLTSEPTDTQYIFRNCISANNILGFNVNSAGTPYIPNVNFYNNTSAYDDIGFAENNATYVGGTVVYKNNIAFPHTTQIGWTAPCAYSRKAEMNSVTDHNSWDAATGVTVTSADFTSVDYAQLSGARQADGSLPVTTFGHLAATSECINAGTDVGLYYEYAPDIGWVEYTEGEPITDALNSTATPSNVSIKQATAGGTVTSDGGGTITARGVCWGLSATPDLTDNVITVTGTTGAFTTTITGLSANTTYHVQSYATNEAGTAYGGDISFTTPEWVPAKSGSAYVFSGVHIIKIK